MAARPRRLRCDGVERIALAQLFAVLGQQVIEVAGLYLPAIGVEPVYLTRVLVAPVDHLSLLHRVGQV